MKYTDEYRDGGIARALASEIARCCTRPWVLMEICGGQTHTIMRYGIDQFLPKVLELVHGPGCPVIAILAQREGLEFESRIESDSAALNGVVAEMLAVTTQIRCMRDPTRGGLSSVLNEIGAQSGVGIELIEQQIPVREEVRGACEMLGLDPLYVANEGKLIAIVAPNVADALLDTVRRHPLGRNACMIGTVTENQRGLVTMRTALGTTRIVDMLPGDQLPRIC